jgi:excisionase family DNA binding protein
MRFRDSKCQVLAAGLLQVEPAPAASPELLSVAAAAALAPVSTTTIYRACRDNHLPHTRRENAIRIARQDLGAWAAKH